ncbi:hypothetical protein AKG98_2192 [Moritella sp. JT01]|nr:hypothetical protein AKG98_2192 [Moritella sp. JT01]
MTKPYSKRARDGIEKAFRVCLLITKVKATNQLTDHKASIMIVIGNRIKSLLRSLLLSRQL